MNTYQFLVSPEDCLVLLAIRNAKTLREAAKLMGCDAGGLLRKVQRISEQHGLLQKREGKWTLTDQGIALVGWTQETILSQKKVLLSETALRIASTAWFSERALIPETAALIRHLGESAEVEYSVPDAGLERALIEGDCDFVIACHPPEDPLIAHKQVAAEKWSAVMAAKLAKKHFPGRAKPSLEDLSPMPFIRHHGLNPDSLLPPSTREKSMVSADNLIAIRSALVSGFGWSYVPTALVKKEIDSGLLISFETGLKMDRKVCLWWLRTSQARKKSSLLEAWLRDICSRI